MHKVATIVLLAALLYTSQFIFSGWIPHDEGVLAQSAERALLGEIPHVDFDEPYTGGLTYLHALGFKLLGPSIASMRWVLLFFVCCYHFLAYQFFRSNLRFWPATLLLALTVAWGPVNYFAPLPSWYVFFFSFFSYLALDRYLRQSHLVYLALAGALSALGFLAKLPGAYTVGAGYLFLFFRLSSGTTTGPAWAARMASLSAPLAVLMIIAPKISAETIFYFLLPAIFIVLPIIAPRPRNPEGTRNRSALEELLVFSCGVALPLMIFACPYIYRGQFDSLLKGIFVTPSLRYELAFYPLPPLRTALFAIPLLIAAGAAIWSKHHKGLKSNSSPLFHLPLLTLGFFLIFPWGPDLYSAVWMMIRTVPPLICIVIPLVLLMRRNQTAKGEIADQSIFLVGAFVALTTLIQFPYSFGIYFIYSFGFIAVSATHLFQIQNIGLRRAATLFILFFCGFGFLLLHPGSIRTKGVRFSPNQNTTQFTSDRTGIRVAPGDAALYSALLDFIKARSKSETIFAGPDSPEVYFLANKKNPTRIFYEFFNPAESEKSALLESIRNSSADLAVINLYPEFSRPFQASFHDGLMTLFTKRSRIGRFFVYYDRLK
jgi:hypothetical protein